LARPLARLDRIVRSWNAADDAHDFQTCNRLSVQIAALVENLCQAMLRRYASPAVREYFGADPREPSGRARGRGGVAHIHHVPVFTDGLFVEGYEARDDLPGDAAMNNAGGVDWLALHSSLQRITVETGSRDEEGCLVYVQDRLVAVLVRLDEEEHSDLDEKGQWFLEAGFGPCANGGASTLAFGSLDEAQRWALYQVASAGRGS
jgi:hypothetical protein